MGTVERVSATDAALTLIQKLKAEHGPLMFHQSGGCCDGSSPMCYPEGEFLIGAQDVLLGAIGGCPFYMDRRLYEYSKHTAIIVDVSPGPGSDFSLEGLEGLKFLTRSRLFTDEEWEQLQSETELYESGPGRD